ncbi:MAG: cold shock domain-containing protein [Pirellula staleyi]
MRVGHIIKVVYDRKFGFIKTEHFRDDVFFHFSVLKELQGRFLEEGQEVEFEINEILRLDEEKLEATIVQAASRPLIKSLDEKAIPEMQASHHPRARQRKPIWREKQVPSIPISEEATSHENDDLSRGSPS